MKVTFFSTIILASQLAFGLCDISKTDKQHLEQIGALALARFETTCNSYQLAVECIKEKVPGDFVECGVFAGAQCAAMALASLKLDANRAVHLWDSFEGIPLASSSDNQQPGIGKITHDTTVDPSELLVSSGISICSLDQVKGYMRSWKVDKANLVYHKGWFQHTLPVDAPKIDKIAVLRLDGDLYDSTKVCLEHLYHKVSKGGYVIIDDYALEGCRKAVDEFLDKHDLKPEIVGIHENGPAYWKVDEASSLAKEEYFRFFYPPYYSQCGQDKFVNEHIFKNKKSGVFLDVGAHDGVSYSNSYFFEKDLDWTGICVEPHPERFRDLIKIRSKKTVCLPVAVADFEGKSKFLQVTGYPEMLSGLLDYYDPRHLDRVDQEISGRGGGKVAIDVQVLKLKDILVDNKITHVDFMSVDTEGSEIEVLKSIDFSKVEIDVIVVENNFGENTIKDFLSIENYKLIRKIGGDEVYVNAKTFKKLF